MTEYVIQVYIMLIYSLFKTLSVQMLSVHWPLSIYKPTVNCINACSRLYFKVCKSNCKRSFDKSATKL